MSDKRRKNVDWDIGDDLTWDKVKLAVLMDIRDELQTLNRLLGCSNFVNIPNVLIAIKANTAKPKRKASKS